jgi:hypothetical protein
MNTVGGSTNGMGTSIERKTTQGGSTNNNSVSNHYSTAKKKKVMKSNSNSRNNTHLKHSQSSMTLVNGSVA